MTIDYRPDNTIIFTVARMNPPTPGHLSLIEKLIQTGIEKNVEEVYVILSNSNSNNENPIACQEKIDVLGNFNSESKTMIKSMKNIMIEKSSPEISKKIEAMRVKLICVPESAKGNIFYVINEITQLPAVSDINAILIIGEDRKNMLDSVYSFLSKNPNFYSLDGIILEREDMNTYKSLSSDRKKLETINMETFPVKAMSASFVRNIVKYDLYDKFAELYRPYLDDSKIRHFYDKIKSGLELPDNKSKSEREVKLKYTYPKINESHTNELLPSLSSSSQTKPQKKSEGKTVKRKYSEPKMSTTARTKRGRLSSSGGKKRTVKRKNKNKNNS